MAENITQTDENTISQHSENKKRYYWLKLMDGFFDNKYIKILRKKENGDKAVIIYLMLQLRAIKTEGIIDFMRLMPSIEEEIAIDIGENVEEVKAAIDALKSMGLIELLDNASLYMNVKEELLNYGSETSAAERQRRSREKRKNEQIASRKTSTELLNPNSNKRGTTNSVVNSESEYTSAFTEFWEAYPKKIGKGEAYKKYKARRNDGYSDEELLSAAKNYAFQVKKQKTDKQYIKHPKTFLSDALPFLDFISKKEEQHQIETVPNGKNPFENWDAEI